MVNFSCAQWSRQGWWSASKDESAGFTPFRSEEATHEVRVGEGHEQVEKNDEQVEAAEEYKQPRVEDDTGAFAVDENLSAIDKQYAARPESLPSRIHIIGTGNIGRLVAHSLRSLTGPPPVSLIFHRYKLLEAWEASKKQITLREDGYDVPRSGFDVELQVHKRREHEVELDDGQPSAYDIASDDVRPHEIAQRLKQQQEEPNYQPLTVERPKLPGDNAVSNEPIHNLIVTTKASTTFAAISEIRHRILPTSTLCFLQNGMGIIDEINSKIFPDKTTRPNYMQGIVTHGAHNPRSKSFEDPFYTVHAGHGTIALGLLPNNTNPTTVDSPFNVREKWSSSSRFLLRTLTRSPVLCAVGFPPIELLQQQLEKLAVNSVINPLTALLDGVNGVLLYNFALTRTARLLLAETSHIIRHLPELQHVPNVNVRFSPERLETLVVGICNKTKENVSSMLDDVRKGRKTEIEYLNGYIVRRGEEMGFKALVNYAVMQMVDGKRQMVGRELREEGVPMAGSAGRSLQ